RHRELALAEGELRDLLRSLVDLAAEALELALVLARRDARRVVRALEPFEHPLGVHRRSDLLRERVALHEELATDAALVRDAREQLSAQPVLATADLLGAPDDAVERVAIALRALTRLRRHETHLGHALGLHVDRVAALLVHALGRRELFLGVDLLA